MTEQKLSTSRIAELAGIDSKALFALLSESDWIKRENGHWRLTAHGEFEGGSYQKSDKYGEYVVWPQSIIEKPLIKNFEEEWLSSTKLSEVYTITAHQVNLLLSELGWLNKEQRGWVVTERGLKIGGSQREGQHGLYVLWPGAIKHNQELVAALENITGKSTLSCLDGHQCDNAGEKQIDNWLYLHGLAHAYKRLLPGSNSYHCGFYLPLAKVYIDYWGFDAELSLSQKLEKQEFYQSHGLKLVEISDEDLQHLDSVLPQKLLQFGIQMH